MVRALFDTNILIDYLNNFPQADHELEAHPERLISIVSWMEVMVGADAEQETATRQFLKSFYVVGIDDAIVEEAVRLRRARRLKFPDAIIWATARTRDISLVTRNTKDFPADDPTVRVPYRL
jgi:predicted nucleic acid-binding protein